MPQAPGSSQAVWNRQATLNRCASSLTATYPSPTAPTSKPRNTSAASGSSSALTWTKRWPGDAKPSSPAGFLSRCERSSKSGRIENHLVTETRNEKAQNFRTHLAGRRNPGSQLGRRRRLRLRRLDSTLSQPRWQRCNPRSAWRELRSAAWPAHLRSLVGLLAEGAEQSYVGRPQRRDEIHRDPPAGKP